MAHVDVKFADSVCNITLSRPEKKNALTSEMYVEVENAVRQASSQQDCRLICIRALGDMFSAGNDLHEFAATEGQDNLADNVAFMRTLSQCPLPIVIAVQGTAVGIGVTMLLHADIVVCADTSKLVMPFVDLGLVPEFASSLMVPAMAGHRKAARWLMLSEPMTAQEALDIGLVSYCVDAALVHSKTDDVVKTLLSKPHYALVQTKHLMKAQQEEIQLHMNEELDIFDHLLESEDAKAAFARFLNKS